VRVIRLVYDSLDRRTLATDIRGLLKQEVRRQTQMMTYRQPFHRRRRRSSRTANCHSGRHYYQNKLVYCYTTAIKLD